MSKNASFSASFVLLIQCYSVNCWKTSGTSLFLDKYNKESLVMICDSSLMLIHKLFLGHIQVSLL